MSSPHPFAAIVIAGLLAGPCLADAPPLLHVPSPDWRDQVIYFAMIDRFDDGDPGNNDQGAGVFDPGDHRRYSGGDLLGLARRVDYLRELGVTALWITPPVANQWWNGGYGGYHGYWASDFSSVDAHYGTLEDYRHLSDRLHRAGMYLVQDVVFNHTGDYFGYDARRDPDDPAAGYRPNAASVPTAAPTQWPFTMNDPRDPAQRDAGIYHWTPEITDYGDPEQELTWQMSGLDDLATPNPVVRRALRESYGHWIREVGVDAFRVDTAFYVATDDLRDILYSGDLEAPGLMRVATATGREDFLVFGEGFAIDRAFDERQSRKIEGYVTDPQGRPVLHSMLNFPLYGALGDVFTRGRPPAELADRIERMMRIHADPHRMPSFIDNHDVDRFLAGGDEAGLRQALLALMTLPGIPTLYYGTEQGFTQRRAAMFAGGWASGGRDHFDTTHPLFGYVRDVIELRRSHRALSRGWPWPLHGEAESTGLLAWRIDHEGEVYVVAFNTSPAPGEPEAVATGLDPGTALQPVFALVGDGDTLTAGMDGQVELSLPPRAGRVWHAHGDDHAPPGQRLPRFEQRHAQRPQREWALLAEARDPAGDDHGPDGRYRYPTGSHFQRTRPADIRHVRLLGDRGALRIEVQTAHLSTTWNPGNGFDHVALSVFIELPDVDGGATVMPLQNASLPDGMRWHRRIRAHGWSNALFSSEAADAGHEGTPVAPAALVEADPDTHTIAFTLPAPSLGIGEDLSGLRVYVSTWDYDDGFRALAAEPAAYTFGGGDPGDPKVMDDTAVLVVP